MANLRAFRSISASKLCKLYFPCHSLQARIRPFVIQVTPYLSISCVIVALAVNCGGPGFGLDPHYHKSESVGKRQGPRPFSYHAPTILALLRLVVSGTFPDTLPLLRFLPQGMPSSTRFASSNLLNPEHAAYDQQITIGSVTTLIKIGLCRGVFIG